MNFMSRVLFFCFVLFVGCFFVAGEWGDINSEEDRTNDSSSDSEEIVSPSHGAGLDASDSKGGYFTSYFYWALFMFVVLLLLAGVFVWFWIRGPRNKWNA